MERVFRSEIPERERMLTHEMKWGANNYGHDASVETASWWMQVCDEKDQERLRREARAIYASFGGNGYCRMDLREDHRTGKIYVVDVNGRCKVESIAGMNIKRRWASTSINDSFCFCGLSLWMLATLEANCSIDEDEDCAMGKVLLTFTAHQASCIKNRAHPED